MTMAGKPLDRRRARSRTGTRGTTHSPITRLVSPSDLGEVMKPLVFLDHVVFPAGGPRRSMQDNLNSDGLCFVRRRYPSPL